MDLSSRKIRVNIDELGSQLVEFIEQIILNFIDHSYHSLFMDLMYAELREGIWGRLGFIKPRVDDIRTDVIIELRLMLCAILIMEMKRFLSEKQQNSVFQELRSKVIFEINDFLMPDESPQSIINRYQHLLNSHDEPIFYISSVAARHCRIRNQGYASRGSDDSRRRPFIEAATFMISETKNFLNKLEIVGDEMENSSIIELSSLIFKNSIESAEALKEYVNDSTEQERLKKRMYMTLEFIYFWMHITNRIAFGVLGNDLRVNLQKELGLLVIEPTVDSFFGHWTEKLKHGILMDIFENLNDAEIEYSNCKAINPKDNSFPYKELFSKLAINVVELSGQTDNTAMFTQIIALSTDALKNMRLKELVDAVGKEL